MAFSSAGFPLRLVAIKSQTAPNLGAVCSITSPSKTGYVYLVVRGKTLQDFLWQLSDILFAGLPPQNEDKVKV